MGYVGITLDKVVETGGHIKFLADGLDTAQPGARQIVAILAEQARAESDAISWRVGQWHEHNRRLGIWRGRPASRLLSGFGRCGLCNYKLNYQLNRRQRQGLNLNSIHWRCAAKTKGRACPGVFISNRLLEPEVVRRYREKLAALEPGDPLFEHVAEQWLEPTIPDSEADRKILEEARATVEQRISDLYRDRYEANLFLTTDDLVEWERLLRTAQEQRRAVIDQLDALGRRPSFDIEALLDGEASEGWKQTPLARRCQLLKLAINWS